MLTHDQSVQILMLVGPPPRMLPYPYGKQSGPAWDDWAESVRERRRYHDEVMQAVATLCIEPAIKCYADGTVANRMPVMQQYVQDFIIWTKEARDELQAL